MSTRVKLVDYLEYERVAFGISVEFPDFRIVAKSRSKLMKVINFFLRVITLGSMKTFMQTYTTTIGTTVYVGASWSSQPHFSRASTLRHEAVHMRQRKRYGMFLFSLMYLFLPLPIGLALGRRNIEREGYEESLRANAEYYGIEALSNGGLRSRIVGQFMGSSYFWMWPFRKDNERWYDRFVSDLEKAYIRD